MNMSYKSKVPIAPISQKEVLKIFFQEKSNTKLSPKDVDSVLKIGQERAISIFMALEIGGFVEWVSLRLLDLELERSTRVIMNEVYNSYACLTEHGSNLKKEFIKTLATG